MVRSFAVWPREFLSSRVTPYCKNTLKIYGAAPAAASITLLLPEQSTSCQWRPYLRRIYTISRWFLKLAQCNGFGFNYLVEPIATCLFSGLTSRYCWPAPFASKSLTMGVNPEQHAHMRAFHFFLLFSTSYELNNYLNRQYQPFSWYTSRPRQFNFS